MEHPDDNVAAFEPALYEPNAQTAAPSRRRALWKGIAGGIAGLGLLGLSMGPVRSGPSPTTPVTAPSPPLPDNSVKGEIMALQSAVTSLQGQVAALQTALASETTRAEAAEAALQASLAAEAGTRQTADNTLQTALNTEVARAQGAENGLNDAIHAETSARLQGDLDAVASAQTYTDSRVMPTHFFQQGDGAFTLTSSEAEVPGLTTAVDNGSGQDRTLRVNVHLGIQVRTSNPTGGGNVYLYLDGNLISIAGADLSHLGTEQAHLYRSIRVSPGSHTLKVTAQAFGVEAIEVPSAAPYTYLDAELQ